MIFYALIQMCPFSMYNTVYVLYIFLLKHCTMFKNMKIFLSTVITLFIKSITHRHLSSVLSSHHSIVQLLLTTNSFYSQFPLPIPNQFDCVQSRLNGPHTEEDVKDLEVCVCVHTDTPSVQRISLLYESVEISERGHVRGN